MKATLKATGQEYDISKEYYDKNPEQWELPGKKMDKPAVKDKMEKVVVKDKSGA